MGEQVGYALMGMLAIVQYEVHVYQQGRWALHARYTRDDRREALIDARTTEIVTGFPTKVIRDAYYPESNSSEENTIYFSPKAKEMSAAARAARAQAGAPGAGKRPGRLARPRRHAAAHAATGADIVFRIAVTVGFSLVAATLVTGLVSWVLTKSGGFGMGLAPDTVTTLLGVCYVSMFLFSCIALFRGNSPLSRILAELWRAQKKALAPSPSLQQQYAGPPLRMKPKHDRSQSPETLREWQDLKIKRGDLDAPLPPETVDADMKEQVVEEPVAPSWQIQTPTPEETAAQEAEARKALEDAKKKKDKDTEKQAADARKAADEKAAAEAKKDKKDQAKEAPAVAKEEAPFESLVLERLVMSRFVADAVMPTLASKVPDDPVSRRGVALYLSGAVAALAQMSRLGPATEINMLSEALTRTGANPVTVDTFLGERAQHTAAASNAVIVEAGRNDLQAYLNGGHDLSDRLAAALTLWRTPASLRPASGLLETYLLTEVRDLDRDAPEADTAMGLHNGIVRAVLREHDGQEIKHTGKGIFARFASPSAAVEAALTIRRRLQEAAGPELAQSLVGNTAPGEDPSLTPLLSQQAHAALARARNGGIVTDTRVSTAYRGPSGLHVTPLPSATEETLALAELDVETLPGAAVPVA